MRWSQRRGWRRGQATGAVAIDRYDVRYPALTILSSRGDSSHLHLISPSPTVLRNRFKNYLHFAEGQPGQTERFHLLQVISEEVIGNRI